MPLSSDGGILDLSDEVIPEIIEYFRYVLQALMSRFVDVGTVSGMESMMEWSNSLSLTGFHR